VQGIPDNADLLRTKKRKRKKRREGLKKTKKKRENVCPKKQKSGAPTIDIY